MPASSHVAWMFTTSASARFQGTQVPTAPFGVVCAFVTLQYHPFQVDCETNVSCLAQDRPRLIPERLHDKRHPGMPAHMAQTRSWALPLLVSLDRPVSAGFFFLPKNLLIASALGLRGECHGPRLKNRAD